MQLVLTARFMASAHAQALEKQRATLRAQAAPNEGRKPWAPQDAALPGLKLPPRFTWAPKTRRGRTRGRSLELPRYWGDGDEGACAGVPASAAEDEPAAAPDSSSCSGKQLKVRSVLHVLGNASLHLPSATWGLILGVWYGLFASLRRSGVCQFVKGGIWLS